MKVIQPLNFQKTGLKRGKRNKHWIFWLLRSIKFRIQRLENKRRDHTAILSVNVELRKLIEQIFNYFHNSLKIDRNHLDENIVWRIQADWVREIRFWKSTKEESEMEFLASSAYQHFNLRDTSRDFYTFWTIKPVPLSIQTSINEFKPVVFENYVLKYQNRPNLKAFLPFLVNQESYSDTRDDFQETQKRTLCLR